MSANFYAIFVFSLARMLRNRGLAGTLPFPKRQILGTSKLKDFADDYFNLAENGIKFSKWVKNTVGKGEIARYEHFLLFPQCFQKTCTVGT